MEEERRVPEFQTWKVDIYVVCLVSGGFWFYPVHAVFEAVLDVQMDSQMLESRP